MISYVQATGLFTITDATSPTNRISETALESLINGITYENTLGTPTTGYRTLEFTVTDAEGLSSLPATSTVLVGDLTTGR